MQDGLHEKAVALRALALRAIHSARSGHPGGSLSVADILTTLYFDVMRIRPEQPDWIDRDRLILSKGHACPALYAVLAMRGYFPEEDVLGLRHIDSPMEGHPDFRMVGVDAPSGSLGMGLSQGLGMAMGARYQKKDFRTHVILGDGDLQEGNTWEAIMAAGHHKMDNLVAIYDSNKLQGDAPVEVQLNLGDVGAKVAQFGWHAINVDGHDHAALCAAFEEAKSTKGQPTFIVADTVKGKGVSFMEGVLFWHGSVTMSDQQLADALKELENV